MRNMMICIIFSLLLTGCQKEDVVNKQYEEYEKYKVQLDTQQTFSSQSQDYDIQIITNKTNDNAYRYDVIIDNPKVEMYAIKAMAKIAGIKENQYPSIGMLEEETFSLVPNVIDKKNNIYKGINLSGISSLENATIFLYISYYPTIDKTETRVEEYMEVRTHAFG